MSHNTFSTQILRVTFGVYRILSLSSADRYLGDSMRRQPSQPPPPTKLKILAPFHLLLLLELSIHP
jgi:hypothetical protein